MVKKSLIIIGLLFLLCFMAFTVFYVSRINIYRPIEIELYSDHSIPVNSKVYCVTVLGRKIETTKIHSNLYRINGGYFNNLTIEIDDRVSDTRNNYSVSIKVFEKNGQFSITKHVWSGNTFTITGFGDKNYSEILLAVFHYSNKLILTSIFFLIISLIIVFTIRLWDLNSLSKLILNITIIWGYGWLIFAGFYTYPNAEDLSLAFRPITRAVYGPIDFRYTTNFLYAISPFSLGGIAWYRVNSWLNLLVYTFALYYFFRTVLRQVCIKRLIVFKVSMLVALLHFLSTPSISHDLFWMGSSFVYLVSWSFLLIWVSFLIRFFIWGEGSVYYILSCWFLFFCIGCVETNVILCSAVLFLLIIYSAKYNKKHGYHIAGLVMILLTGTWLIFADYGNSGKVAVSNFTLTGSYIFDQTKIAVDVFVKNLVVVVFTAIPWILFAVNAENNKFPFTLNTMNHGFLLLSSIALLLSMLMSTVFFFLFLSASNFSPDRVMNYIHVGLVLTLIFIVLWVILRFKGLSLILAKVNRSILVNFGLLVFVGYMFFIPNNISLIVKEVCNGSIQRYRMESVKLFQTLNDAQNNGNKIAIVRELNTIPKSIVCEPLLHVSYDEISGNKWVTIYERYFQIEKIIVVTDSLSSPLN